MQGVMIKGFPLKPEKKKKMAQIRLVVFEKMRKPLNSDVLLFRKNGLTPI